MVPAPESPITQVMSSSGKRSRRMLPIIPAIPRSLERRPRSEQEPAQHDNISVTHAIQNSNGILGGNSEPLADKAQIEDTNESGIKNIIGNCIAISPEAEAMGKSAYKIAIVLNVVTDC